MMNEEQNQCMCQQAINIQERAKKHLFDTLKYKKKQDSQVECYMLLEHCLKNFIMESSEIYTLKTWRGKEGD